MNAIAKHRRHILAGALLLGLTAGLSPSLLADTLPTPPRAVQSVVVDYGDLDLTESAATRTLYARLRHAASEACAPQPLVRMHREVADYQACYERALNEAVLGVGSPQLHALHRAGAGRSAVG